jgi:hypothetical protein
MALFSWNFTIPEELEKLKENVDESFVYGLADADAMETFDVIDDRMRSMEFPPWTAFTLHQAFMEEFLTFSIVMKALQVFAKPEKVMNTKKFEFSCHLVEPGFGSEENMMVFCNFIVHHFPQLEELVWSQPNGPTNSHVEFLLKRYASQLKTLRLNKTDASGLNDQIIPLLLKCPQLETLEVCDQFTKNGIKQIQNAMKEGQTTIKLLKHKY